MQRSSAPSHGAGARPHSEFSSQPELGCPDEAALSMHNRVTGWHTPDLQSEFALHLAPTLRAACASAVSLIPNIAPAAEITALITKSCHNLVGMTSIRSFCALLHVFAVDLHRAPRARTGMHGNSDIRRPVG